MKIELNVNEANKVVEALRNVAFKHGWEEDELEDAKVLEEYAAALDAAMDAMGLNLCINVADEEEDEEDEEDEFPFDEDEDEDDFSFEDDDDDDTTTYCLTAKGEFVLQYMNAGYSFSDACEVADILFGEGE